MKEKLLLSFGVVLVLFGVIGVCAVGFAYYYTKPYLDGLPSDLERIFSVASQTTRDASIAIYDVAKSLRTAADNIDISILGWRPFGPTAYSLRATAFSVERVGGDTEIVTEQIEVRRSSILSQISMLRWIIDWLFAWIGILHTLFIMIGVSILCIRKRLKSIT